MVSEGAFLELFVPATPEAHCKQLTIFINYVYFYHGGLGPELRAGRFRGCHD